MVGLLQLVLVSSLLVLPAPVLGSSQSASQVATANPMRRVITLLEQMQAKVTAEGKQEKELYEKFQCYCKTGSGDLTNSIGAAEATIEQDTASLKEAESMKTQLEAELVEHKADKAEAIETMNKGTAIREKEVAVYAKTSGEYSTNIAALAKAIAALEKGVVGSFLQSSGATTLRRLTVDMDMSSADRDVLAAFLSTDAGYVPQSGQIIGILKELKKTMENDLATAIRDEEAAIQTYDILMAAKTKELNANQAAIEAKTERHGNVELEIVQLKEDLDDTAKALLADKQFLADLEKSCATKKAEWEARSKTRQEELLALAETIKILSDDDALELFKKTLPSPASFLQTEEGIKQLKQRALQALNHRHRDSRLDFVALALRGRATNFDKVIKMIDDMVALLGKEQTEDDEKKAYCEAELDKAEDEKKVLDSKSADLVKAINEADGTLAALTEDIANLENDIKELDKQVADSTALRKEEHQEFVDTMAANNAAKQLINLAKNRLAKFYSPELYKPPPKTELSSEHRIAVSVGLLQEGPAVFAQVASHKTLREAPPPAPETWNEYQKKGEEHVGVVAMLELIMTDLDKDIASGTTDEEDSQKEYEGFMVDSAAKRTMDTTTLAAKESAKADLEAEKLKLETENKATLTEAMLKAEYIKDLHLSCDWLIESFATRQEARAGEVQSLKNAKAALSGADYSLVQKEVARNLRGSSLTKVCDVGTSLGASSSEDAAGTPEFSPLSFSDGACMLAPNPSSIKSLKFCGPGKLLINRLTCQNHQYAAGATTYIHSKSEYTSNCETIDLAGTKSEGWLGSYSVSC